MIQGHTKNLNVMILEKNIQALTIKYNTKQKINITKNNDLQFLKSQSGLECIYYKNKYLHSKYQPKKEIEQRLEEITRASFDCIIVLEMGLGYIIDALFEKYPHTPIIAFQKDANLSLQILNHKDFSTLPAFQNLTMFLECTEQDLIDYLIANQLINPYFIITQAALSTLEKTSLEKFHSTLNSYREKNIINQNTLKKFQYRWINNLLDNISSDTHTIYSIETFKDANKDAPILLCAAGPGLEELIPYIPDLTKKMPLVCVDTALAVFHQINVVPDFIVSVDPQFVNSQHLDWHIQWALEHNSKLVIDLSTSSRLLHLIPPHTNIFSYFPNLPIGERLLKYTNLTKDIQSGGSVSNIAWELCRILGSKKIISAGLDLCYTKNKSHCKGTQFEYKNILEATKLRSIEDTNTKKLLAMPNKKFVEDYNNKTAVSNFQLLIFLRWFEAKQKFYQDIENYTCTPDSAKIDGFKLISIDTLLNFSDRNYTQFDCISSKYAVNKEQIELNIIDIVDSLSMVCEILHFFIKSIFTIKLETLIQKIDDFLQTNTSLQIVRDNYSTLIPQRLQISNKFDPEHSLLAQQDILKQLQNIYFYTQSLIQIFKNHTDYSYKDDYNDLDLLISELDSNQEYSQNLEFAQKEIQKKIALL